MGELNPQVQALSGALCKWPTQLSSIVVQTNKTMSCVFSKSSRDFAASFFTQHTLAEHPPPASTVLSLGAPQGADEQKPWLHGAYLLVGEAITNIKLTN